MLHPISLLSAPPRKTVTFCFLEDVHVTLYDKKGRWWFGDVIKLRTWDGDMYSKLVGPKCNKCPYRKEVQGDLTLQKKATWRQRTERLEDVTASQRMLATRNSWKRGEDQILPGVPGEGLAWCYVALGPGIVKEGRVLKNWCFQIVMLEKTLESP